MAFESLKNRNERLESLDSVPDWRYHPCSFITAPGTQVSRIEIEEGEEEISLPSEVESIKMQLEPYTKPESFFDGPFPGVTDIQMGPDGTIQIKTKKTSNFAYVAASYAFKDNESKNPVRPFSTQITVFSPDRKKVLLERRLHSLDHGDTRTTFGGVLKQGETNIVKTLVERIAAKSKHDNELYVPDLTESQITPTGITRDNITNVYCAAYMVTLTKEQYDRVHKFAEIDSKKEEDGTRKRYYFELGVDAIEEKLDSLWRWEPSTYANVLYALASAGIRTPEEVRSIVAKAEEKLRHKPMTYTYPAARILGLDGEAKGSGRLGV